MGQGGQGLQGNRACTMSEVGFRRRSNHQYGKQKRAYMRLDKKRSGLAFGLPASRHCAAGTRRTFKSNFREYCTLFITFLTACVAYIVRRIG